MTLRRNGALALRNRIRFQWGKLSQVLSLRLLIWASEGSVARSCLSATAAERCIHSERKFMHPISVSRGDIWVYLAGRGTKKICAMNTLFSWIGFVRVFSDRRYTRRLGWKFLFLRLAQKNRAAAAILFYARHFSPPTWFSFRIHFSRAARHSFCCFLRQFSLSFTWHHVLVEYFLYYPRYDCYWCRRRGLERMEGMHSFGFAFVHFVWWCGDTAAAANAISSGAGECTAERALDGALWHDYPASTGCSFRGSRRNMHTVPTCWNSTQPNERPRATASRSGALKRNGKQVDAEKESA